MNFTLDIDANLRFTSLLSIIKSHWFALLAARDKILDAQRLYSILIAKLELSAYLSRDHEWNQA